MKKILIALVSCFVLMPAAAKAGGDVTDVDLPPWMGKAVDDLKTCEVKLQKSFGDLKACEEELRVCEENLDDCLGLKQQCEEEREAAITYIEEGCVGPKPSFVKHEICDDGMDNDNDGKVDCYDKECCSKSYCTGKGVCKPKPKPKQSDCQKCRSSKYNGLCGDWSWYEEYCGIEAELDGKCLTLVQVYEADQCLAKKIEGLEKTGKSEIIIHSEESGGGDYVSPADVQKVVDVIMLEISKLREEIETHPNAETFKFMEPDLSDHESRLKLLEERVDLLYCCIFVDDLPGYCSDTFELDPKTKLPTAESYAEKCGILAKIPEMQEVLDDHEARLKKLESQVEQNTKDIEDLKSKNLELKLPPWIAFEIGLAPMLLGTGLGDVYISPTALKIGLVIKHDGIDLFELQGRFGVMLQANDAHDCERYGVGGGVDFFFYPGPQQIFGLGAGYAVASMGGYVIEYEGHVMPDGSTQIEPDRQDDFVLGKLKAKYYKNLKTRNNYLWGLGFEAEAGVGGVFMHDYWGTGWHVGYQFLFGIVFHLPVPGVPAPSDKPAEE